MYINTIYCNIDSNDCVQCTTILEELENIDDDCDRHGITFIKTQVSLLYKNTLKIDNKKSKEKN